MLARPFLWDKVGRAIRSKEDPERFESEVAIELKPWAGCNFNSANRREKIWGRLLASIQRKRAIVEWKLKVRLLAQSILFPVAANDRIAQAVDRLREDFPNRVILVKEDIPPFKLGLNCLTSQELDLAVEAATELAKHLESEGVVLSDVDKENLKNELTGLVGQLASADTVLSHVRPACIVVYADNHPPCQPFVAVARREAIPVVMLQHGLDCERHFLDDAYADYIAVWGPERAKRYSNYSEEQPTETRVIGCPSMGSLERPERLRDGAMGDWAYVTRPHHPRKCLAPSRWPDEGRLILRAILGLLPNAASTRLVIKTHPEDLVDWLEDEVASAGMTDRVSFYSGELDKLFSSASLVITEDSTVGLDAMLKAVPLVHAHFAESPPAMPFVEFEAALSGYNHRELQDSILQIHEGNFDRPAMNLGQSKFIQEFAGPLDGTQLERLSEFVGDIIRNRKK
jgi:hypothetical protein